MKSISWFIGIAAVVAVGGGCEIFEERTAENIFFRMDGTSGGMVSVIYSKQFVAGVDELGVTRLEIFRSDTAVHALPFDTVIDIRVERQIFIQAEPLNTTDTLSVDAQVDVDDRSLYDESGQLYPTIPWRFLYRFNHRFTDVIEVVF